MHYVHCSMVVQRPQFLPTHHSSSNDIIMTSSGFLSASRLPLGLKPIKPDCLGEKPPNNNPVYKRWSEKGSELPGAWLRRRPKCPLTVRKRTLGAHFGPASWHCLGLTGPLSGHALSILCIKPVWFLALHPLAGEGYRRFPHKQNSFPVTGRRQPLPEIGQTKSRKHPPSRA